MIGCKNDCYRPEEALSASLARQFHAWQVEQLSQLKFSIDWRVTWQMHHRLITVILMVQKNY